MRLLAWVVDHPAPAGGALVVVTLLLVLALPRLRIDESAEGLIVERDPARAFYDQARARFGSDDLTVLLVKADDVFTPAALGAVKRLTEAVGRLPRVSRVESLTTVKNIRGEGDTLSIDPLIDGAVPGAPEALARLRADALGHRALVNNLVSRDGRATAAELYMVVTGRVRVFDPSPDGGERTLTVLRPGGVFGEIAVLTQEVRSASVVAEEPSELLRLDFAALEQIRRRYPYTGAKLFRNLARMLGERLREATGPRVDEVEAGGR